MTFAQLLAIGALSVACSGGPDEPGSSTSMTVGQFCQESAELICANLAGCCSLSVEDCVEAHRSGCEESGGNATRPLLRRGCCAALRGGIARALCQLRGAKPGALEHGERLRARLSSYFGLRG